MTHASRQEPGRAAMKTSLILPVILSKFQIIKKIKKFNIVNYYCSFIVSICAMPFSSLIKL